jgi:hypothetical protein
MVTEGSMNIDERLDALTHTVELLAGMQGDNQNRLARLEESMTTVADGMAQLTRIVLSHHERIEKLEGN